VVLFVQYALAKFKVSSTPHVLFYFVLDLVDRWSCLSDLSSSLKFENHQFTKNNRTVSSASFTDVDTFSRVHGRTAEFMSSWNIWFKALFDSSSEGIEDNILR